MIYENVKKLCEENSISIRQLEDEIGLGNGTIGKWVNSVPNVTTVKKVADYFNVPIEYFLEE